VSKPKVAYIGIGIMGRGMARRLLGAGFPVTVHNRTRAKAEALLQDGARVASSAAEAAADADVVITNVPDSPDVEAAVAGPKGVLETVRRGSVVVDHSTISPAVTRRLAAMVEAKGAQFLDAPVTGGEVGAANGTLTIMVGGPAAAFERVRPILEVEGKTIVHVSPENGAGQIVKLINNTVIATFLGAYAEGLALARKAGVEVEKVTQVLNSGLARSASGDSKWPKMVAADWKPSFFLRLHDKDLALAMEAARAAGCVMPLGATVAQLYRAGVQMGLGDLDNAAVAKVVAQLNGLP
jgi:2-hydroxy-3-oxopropionate reductase